MTISTAETEARGDAGGPMRRPAAADRLAEIYVSFKKGMGEAQP
jgi:hypothetical protein